MTHATIPDGFGRQTLAHGQVAAAFVARFGRAPALFAAPGRINLIGEHTDYSGGFAMPAAIDRRCIVAVAPNGGDVVRMHSLNLDAYAEVSAGAFSRAGAWSDYVAGAAAAVRRAGHAIPGCDIVIGSDVPLGAGVSSSAALETASVLAVLSLTGAAPACADIARLAWEAETDFVGAPCGPMDQFASVHGVSGAALLLDCRALTATATPLPEGVGIFLVESGVRHRIVDGGYAARRRDCEEAAAMLGVAALRDAHSKMLARLDGVLLHRARHVVSENARTLAFADALRADDLAGAGRLMTASHASLRDDFDVTCPETDALVELATATPGVHGARQMGGGFGGGVIVLADAARVEDAAETITSAYRARASAGGRWFPCTPADGAGPIA